MSTEQSPTNSNTQNLDVKLQPTVAISAEIQQFISYLLRVVPLAIDLNSANETNAFERTLQETASAIDGIRRFLSDAQCIVFFIRVIQQGKGRYQNCIDFNCQTNSR